eukprot:147222_1
MFRLITPLKSLQMKAFKSQYRFSQRAIIRYYNTNSIHSFTLAKRWSTSAMQPTDHNPNLIQMNFAFNKLQQIIQPTLPQTFFVYGTLRDDDNSNAYYTKDFVQNCTAKHAKLYG